MSEKKVYKSPSGLEAEIILGNCDTGNQKNMQLWSSNIYWVREDIRNIRTSFIKLGFHLNEIKRCEAYRIYGYDDFYEFCDNNFHLSDSTVRRHIQIYERFGEYRDNSMKMNIAPEYEKYSYSQLCEMLPVAACNIHGITPSMTIKEIREYKASLKNEKLQALAEPEVCDVAHNEKDSEEEFYDKPDDFASGLISDFAVKLIYDFHDWLLKDYENRVLNVLSAEKELKIKLCSPNHSRFYYFKSSSGELCHINFFDDYIQLWHQNSCLGDYEWFYLCAALQSKWNFVVEKQIKSEVICDVAQTEPEQDESFVDELMTNVYQLIAYINQKDCVMASASVRVLCDKLKRYFEVD